MRVATDQKAPLRLHWWKAVPNFGDALNPMVVGHMAGRAVQHAGPKGADLFAIGSLVQVIKRNFSEPHDRDRPMIWGTGLLHAVQGTDFLKNVNVSLLRGPITAALLGLEHRQFGDPGLLIDTVLPFEGTQVDRIGIVPHHSLVNDPELLAFCASDPAYMLIDPSGDAKLACQQIAGCAHVLSSSLHGLIVADAYGVSNTWLAPKGQSWLKYLDYAASVGRGDMAAPVTLDTLPRITSGKLSYQNGIDAARAALVATFPTHLKAAA